MPNWDAIYERLRPLVALIEPPAPNGSLHWDMKCHLLNYPPRLEVYFTLYDDSERRDGVLETGGYRVFNITSNEVIEVSQHMAGRLDNFSGLRVKLIGRREGLVYEIKPRNYSTFMDDQLVSKSRRED